MSDMAFGLYVAALVVVTAIYVWIMLEIKRSETGNPFTIKFGRGKNREVTQKSYHPVEHSRSEVQAEINQLYVKMESLSGEARIKVWNQIQELKKALV